LISKPTRKENRYQPIVDPFMARLGQCKFPEADGGGRPPDRMVAVLPSRIGPYQRSESVLATSSIPLAASIFAKLVNGLSNTLTGRLFVAGTKGCCPSVLLSGQQDFPTCFQIRRR
jgi:hypothetical protein